MRKTNFSCSSGMISNFPRGANSGRSPAVEQSSESKLVERSEFTFPHFTHNVLASSLLELDPPDIHCQVPAMRPHLRMGGTVHFSSLTLPSTPPLPPATLPLLSLPTPYTHIHFRYSPLRGGSTYMEGKSSLQPVPLPSAMEQRPVQGMQTYQH